MAAPRWILTARTVVDGFLKIGFLRTTRSNSSLAMARLLTYCRSVADATRTALGIPVNAKATETSVSAIR
jgi:hypothetical protein